MTTFDGFVINRGHVLFMCVYKYIYGFYVTDEIGLPNSIEHDHTYPHTV